MDEVIIIGAGQAGLSASWHLAQRGMQHVLLERYSVGSTWERERWDSFTLVTPNAHFDLPGFPYRGTDPEGFMPRDQIVQRLRDYARASGAPVRSAVDVRRLRPITGGAFELETTAGSMHARNVIVATGGFQQPKRPHFAQDIGPRILQMHTSDYRNPEQLPDGGILVVGTGQSGAQIAEDLHEAGRDVVLSVCSCGRMPRRYRGRDISAWMYELAKSGKMPMERPDPPGRFRCNAHLSGKNGGHEINLRRLAKDGIRLVGRTAGADGTRLSFANDLQSNLAAADASADAIKDVLDRYIEASGIAAPREEHPSAEERELVALPLPDPPVELDLVQENISTVIWGTGFRYDYSWIDAPGILHETGYPIHEAGASPLPGVYFVGLQWQIDPSSSLLAGVGRDAGLVVDHLHERMTSTA